MADLWFWQRIVTPHMAGLVVALARQGHTVSYVAEREMSTNRARQGWSRPELPDVSLHLADSAAAIEQAVAQASVDSIHICQGIRGNGLVAVAQRALKRRRLKQWVIMETVEDRGWEGFAKRILYRALFMRWRRHLQGVLATGWRTADWVRARGMPGDKVFPFAYFLPDVSASPEPAAEAEGPFRVLFVGQFIERKRLDLLIDALGQLAGTEGLDPRLLVVGSGPLEGALRTHAERTLGHRVEWIGRQPMDQVRHLMSSADCLVLPSRYDGWGAVVSEALMAGTPVIASDACGSAGVVRASGRGGVFPVENPEALKGLLRKALRSGRVPAEQRSWLADWGRSLGAEAGAAYLSAIIDHMGGWGDRPTLPWIREMETGDT